MDAKAVIILLLSLIFGVVALAYWSMALLDVLRVGDDSEFQSGSKTLWVVVLILTGIFGAFIYRAAGQPKTPQSAAASSVIPRTPGIIWTCSGVRYLLGYSTQPPTFSIWDRSQPGPPILSFPYDANGKTQAEAKFREMEPNGRRVVQGRVPLRPGNAYGFEGDPS